jgi:hypothetical protein
MLTESPLRDEVRRLADEAFHHKLISGYGDGEFSDKFQIVYQGKPMHYLLDEARDFLTHLLETEAPAAD